MHEMSLVANIIRIAEEEAQKHKVAQLTRISVSIGFLSPIETCTLTECFALMAQSSLLQGTKLLAHKRKLDCTCKNCNHSFVLDKHPLRCPLCTGNNIHFTNGYGLIIENIEAKKTRTIC